MLESMVIAKPNLVLVPCVPDVSPILWRDYAASDWVATPGETARKCQGLPRCHPVEWPGLPLPFSSLAPFYAARARKAGGTRELPGVLIKRRYPRH